MTHEQKIYRHLAYLIGIADALADTHPKVAQSLRAAANELENHISDALVHAAGSAVGEEIVETIIRPAPLDETTEAIAAIHESLDEAEAEASRYSTRQEGDLLRIYDGEYTIATYYANGSDQSYAAYCEDCNRYGIDPLPREGWGGTRAEPEAAQ